MPVLTIEVTSRVVGGSPEAPTLAPVTLTLLDERLTVAELIRRSVEEQVRELRARRRLAATQARAALDRQYLTHEEMVAQATRGKVSLPSHRAPRVPQIEPELEVEKALAAFQAGSYVVLVDGRQVESLAETVSFAPGTRVVFLRLMPLVGG